MVVTSQALFMRNTHTTWKVSERNNEIFFGVKEEALWTHEQFFKPVNERFAGIEIPLQSAFCEEKENV